MARVVIVIAVDFGLVDVEEHQRPPLCRLNQGFVVTKANVSF